MSQGLTLPATSHTSVCSPTHTGVLGTHGDAWTQTHVCLAALNLGHKGIVTHLQSLC